ncbi:hypothetical protein MKEN_00543500 [Mycena kentingensis (nom. inval.)]|nr:hypothetical protein MKEN_00543500 [Mycena kentingensis (nom. inval.)]
MLLATLLPLFALPAAVSAHGFVHQVWVNDKKFTGNVPGADPTDSVVRQISQVDPVKGATNAAVNCGHDAQLAADVADANPGDTIGFVWSGGDLSAWPHDTGPMLTYMADCGDDCTTFNSAKAKAGSSRTSTSPQTSPFPSNLAPGNYLIRHEIIALHLAESQGGAEFYPSCTQLRVGGSGTGKPTADELVELPGAYSDTDAGILVKNVFNTPPPKYTFPGPAVAAFVGASSDGDDTSAGGSKTSSAASSSSTGGAKSAGSKPGKSCKLRRAVPSTTSKQKRSPRPRPHNVSRVMRGLSLGLVKPH